MYSRPFSAFVLIGVAPGMIFSRLIQFLPASGISVTCFACTVANRTAESFTSACSAVAVTVTDSAAAPTSSVMFPNANCWNPFTPRFSIRFSLKPGAEILTVYVPTTTAGNVNRPDSVVVVARVLCVPFSVSRTAAPATEPPLESCAVPVIDPKPDCANKGAAPSARDKESTDRKRDMSVGTVLSQKGPFRSNNL